ncbi:Squalene/phytoene synthase-domain-containing protein [Tribonema minus]|uniref:Squalene/phytoene synthase-domain-containing protein n=1 Tax=Tribonema minus TaxID=303371 RepID=A0A835YPK2_9STRA|nr:Squalene/phytoene synthase-domain-containing protein [Tribonema minus]
MTQRVVSRILQHRRALGAVAAHKRALSTVPSMPNPDQHCADIVRKADYDGYLCSLLATPRTARPSLLALRAFNVEIASIKEAVRNNTRSGTMRMQWWMDVVNAVYSGGNGGDARVLPPEPVCVALNQAVQQHGLTRRWLERMIAARRHELEAPGWTSIADLETYAEHTASSLLYLSLEAAGVADERAEHAAGHIGKAVGICTLLRAVQHHSAQKLSVLPGQLLRKHLVASTVLFNGARTEAEAEALAACFYDVACVAKGHMEQGQELASGLSNDAFRALLPGVRAAWYLEALEKAGFNAFDASLTPRSWIPFQFRVARAAMTHKF